MVELAPRLIVWKFPEEYLIVVVLSLPFHNPAELAVFNVPFIVTIPLAGELEFVLSQIVEQSRVLPVFTV